MLILYLSMLETTHEKSKMAELYSLHKYASLHVALSITHDQRMAEDAVHDAFIQVIKNKDKYFSLSCSDFRALIVTIVKNKSIDQMRRQKKIVQTPMDDVDYQLDSGEATLDFQLISKEQFEHISQLMTQLDDTSTSILRMKYLLDMSYKEIAAALDLTPKNIEMRVYRAKGKLREMMSGKEAAEYEPAANK